MAHTIGMLVDRDGLNVFVRRRDLNRAGAPAGKHYRIMEHNRARKE